MSAVDINVVEADIVLHKAFRSSGELRTERWWIKPIIGLVAMAVILLTAPIYGRLTAGGKISEEIDRSAAQVDVTVGLDFAPENYHRETLSDLGVFAGRDRADETKLRLRAVSQSDLEKIANLYWVEGIEPSESR